MTDISIHDLEDRLGAVEDELELNRVTSPEVLNLRYDRLHVLETDPLLNQVSLEARELHWEAVKAALGKPEASYLSMLDLDSLPGVSWAAVTELENVGLFVPVYFENLRIPGGFTLPLINVLCGVEAHKDMPWHPDHREVL